MNDDPNKVPQISWNFGHISSKKGTCYLWGFLFFTSKKPPILKIQVRFFSTYKCFWNFLPKYSELSYIKLIMTEVSRNLRNIFFRKIPPILKLEVGFFSDRKTFSQIFQNTEDLYAVNYIWQNFEQNQRTFLEPIHHHPPPPSTIHRPSH